MEAHVKPESEPKVHCLYVPTSATWQYIVADPSTKHAVIIDPVLDHPHDPNKPEMSTSAADAVLDLVRDHGYVVDRVLETHANTGHLSSAWYLRTQLREATGRVPRIAIGKNLAFVQRCLERNGVHDMHWAKGFDTTFSDNEIFSIGTLEAQVLRLPGLTLDHIGYRIGQNVFLGDPTLNPTNPQGPTAVANLYEGSASNICHSLDRLIDLPPSFRIYTSQSGSPITQHSVNEEHTTMRARQSFRSLRVNPREDAHELDQLTASEGTRRR